MHTLSNIVAIITLVLFMSPANADAKSDCEFVISNMLAGTYVGLENELSLNELQSIFAEHVNAFDANEATKRATLNLYNDITETVYVYLIDKPTTRDQLKTSATFQKKFTEGFVGSYCKDGKLF